MKSSQSLLRWGATVAGLATLASAQDADYDEVICGETAKYTSEDGLYIYGSNAWNAIPDGFQCVSIDDSVPAMDATWLWDGAPENVHSFPHVRFQSEYLPTPMTSIRSLRLKTKWIMTRQANGDPELEPPRSWDQADWDEQRELLGEKGVQANAAWDFFADPNKTKTYNPIDASVEIMIWLGRLGGVAFLQQETNLTTFDIGGTEFTLNYGQNSREQHVFTWFPTDGQDVIEFDADIAPMLEEIRTSGRVPEDLWLGLVEFGTETWYSPVNVTMTAVDYLMELDNGEDPASGDNSESNSDDDDDDDDGAAGVVRVSTGLVLGVAAAAAMVRLW